jgi:glutamate synthase domain-containing protein 2/glutamate synthase domain-containing protein 1/glutamate synthase domain-containing protein 3
MKPRTLQPVPAPLYDERFEHDACGVGFVASTTSASHELVDAALDALAALAHRGGMAADARTGDGAGVSMPLPLAFLRALAAEVGVHADVAARPNGLALGMLFMPDEPAEERFDAAVRSAGLEIVGWRTVPLRTGSGRSADDEPRVRQAFVRRPARMRRLTFARRLHLARRRFERDVPQASVASLSPDTLVYKGLFTGRELGDAFPDLGRPELAVRYAIFHQRYSTNTFPSWRLAQPFRYLGHNGEINTVRGNREQMRGRRNALGAGAWGRQLAREGSVLSDGASDSLSLDEAIELLVLAGRPIEEALTMLIPTAGDERPEIEPWDGPAAIVFGDGRRVGARLDRNGLRPMAWATTRDGLVVAASEAGCLQLPAERIEGHGRLGPGEMLVIDTVTGNIQPPGDAPPLQLTGRAHPARLLVAEPPLDDERARIALGLDAEILRQVVRPMAADGKEAIWSMGDDTPIAPLAVRGRRISDHLRQSFAQVTNPSIDPEREQVVMSLAMELGPRAPLLGCGPRPRSRRLSSPVIAALEPPGADLLDATWPVHAGSRGLRVAVERLSRSVLSLRRRGAQTLVLSDAAVSRVRAPIPTILATARVHQALVRRGVRPTIDLVVDAGDAFDVHDIAMLMAVGATAVHPRLLLGLAAEVAGSRGAEGLTPASAVANAVEALEHGLRKVLARMGISTIRSYTGGQVFETLGLAPELAADCFPAAPTHPGTVGYAAIAAAVLDRHRMAYRTTQPALSDPGLVRFRGNGEWHGFSPRNARALRAVARETSTFQSYREAVARATPGLPRDLLAPRAAGPGIGLEAVEPASEIAKRFVSSAMSLGALSPEAHQALAVGMARLGGSSNTGEGGEDPAWYEPLPSGDVRESAVKQVASARFGVTTQYLARAEQLEIKIAQGSKPGEGGQLPGRKATAFIAAMRRGQPGMTMISPPPHHDIYSIEDLAQLISDLRAVNPRARIGVKLVASAGIGTIAAGVAKARADYIMVSGHSGGTGASPLSSIKHVGLPWELGLAEVHQVLVRNRLRDRVALRTDGGLQTGRDVVVAALLGAEEFGFGTSALIALGCDMARQCHLDTCPTGIATQRPELRAKFNGTPERIVAFFMALAEDVRDELATLGLRSLDEAIGRSGLLRALPGALDVDDLTRAPAWRVPARRAGPPKAHGRLVRAPAASDLEAALLPGILDDLRAGRPHAASAQISTVERSFGAAIAGELARDPVLADARPHVALRLTGAAGQSFGAFAVPEMRLVVEGLANDYVAKGLSGGTVVVRPPLNASFVESEQAIAGNTCLYGATSGRLHLVGRAGMRFAVRNSGASAVVEGIGAHGCEYMTGGTVVVLGPIGPNFGAGMTGGRAFVLDRTDAADCHLNNASVTIRTLATDGTDHGLIAQLRGLVADHAAEGSALARSMLDRWDEELRHVVVVEPREGVIAVTQEDVEATRN